MKARSLARWFARLAAVALLAPGPASAAEVQVMISAGFYDVYAELGPAFERATGHRLTTTRGPSMGDSPKALPTRLARGETADVARGELEIGFQQVSELIHVPGVTYVGTIPAELQPGLSFAGAITSAARQPDAARALLRFLASPEATSAIVKAGLTPPSGRDR